MSSKSEIRCPICKKPSRPADPHFPFCSKRCKLLDLGAWLEGSYRISRPLGPAERQARDSDSGQVDPPGAAEEEEPPPAGSRGDRGAAPYSREATCR